MSQLIRREKLFCEIDKDIIKLDDEGKKHVIVEHSATSLSKLSDVATDKEDNIYCTDRDTNKILRCDKNGKNIRVYKIQQAKGRGHWGVAVVGDEVMLCEHERKGTIMIYNRELKYVRRIVRKDMGKLYNISVDSHGNLCVIDYDKSLIRVFSSDSILLRSFGDDDNGVKRLKQPWGVCVAGQYVYVSNHCGHNLSVFTTAGHYVTSFGHKGQEEGEFLYPCGIGTGKHTMLYVCDFWGHKVQCF